MLSYVLCVHMCCVNLLFSELPAPVIAISTFGIPMVGSAFSVMCHVTTDEDLIPGLVVNWNINGSMVMDTSNIMIVTQYGTSFCTIVMMFAELREADLGNYSCSYELTIPGHIKGLSGSETYTVGASGMLLLSSFKKSVILHASHLPLKCIYLNL